MRGIAVPQGMTGNLLIHMDVVNTYFAGAKISALAPFPQSPDQLSSAPPHDQAVIQPDAPLLAPASDWGTSAWGGGARSRIGAAPARYRQAKGQDDPCCLLHCGYAPAFAWHQYLLSTHVKLI